MATDDVMVADPLHRSVCRHCCLAHDALRAELDSLRIENQNLQAYVRQMHLNGYPHPGKLCGMEHAAESGWTTPVPQPQEQRKP